MKNNPQFKYFAFISYSSRDMEWGKRMQRKLENYRLPATLCREHGWERTPINPVFFAPMDIQPGGLTEELQKRLCKSKNLIVICSPNSAQSEWVAKEIEYFHQLGRTKQIHFFIVDGLPHSNNPNTECFNPIIKTLGFPEILGSNIHEKIYNWSWMNRERAYVQLISKLLGVEFDAIWQRHKRVIINNIMIWSVSIFITIATILCIYMINQPVDVEIRLKETSIRNDNLPTLKDAIVILALDNEIKTDTICTLNSKAFFTNIPQHYINKNIRINVTCRNFLYVDTIITLTKNVELSIIRNPSVYGNINFRLWDPIKEFPMSDVKIEIAGQTVTSDNSGRVCLFIPLEFQQAKYFIKSSIPLLNDTIYLPCGPDDIILTK